MTSDLRIPFLTLPNWIRAAARCGFHIDPLFERFNIKPDLINLEQSTVSLSALDALMLASVEACRQSSPSLHFPFVLGETFSFEYLPEIETYISTSSNLREASKALVWVRELINPHLDIRLAEEGRLAHMYISAEQDSAVNNSVYFAESVLPSVLRFARLLLGDKAQFRLLRFRHAAPDYAEKYADYFHLPIAFNQDYDGIEFDRELLDLPLQGAFPSLHEQAEFLVEKRLAQQPNRHGLAERVTSLLTQQPELLRNGITACAAALGLHPRSLQRRLRAESTHFGQLLDELRFRSAVVALQSGDHDLEALSEQLGFADRRSLTRAFKRWSGLSPSQYRKSLQIS